MATMRTVEVRVSRKISKDYNSTEYSFGAVLDLEPGDDPEAVTSDTTEWLKDQIRSAFRSNGTGSNGGEK